MRPGLGWDGVTHLQNFVKKAAFSSPLRTRRNLAITIGFAQGVSIARPRDMKLVGTIVRRATSSTTQAPSPTATEISSLCIATTARSLICPTASAAAASAVSARGKPTRPTGRGTEDDPDFTPGREAVVAPEEPKSEIWEAEPVTDEQLRNGIP